jgi:hypothetical protein
MRVEKCASLSVVGLTLRMLRSEVNNRHILEILRKSLSTWYRYAHAEVAHKISEYWAPAHCAQ